MTPRTLIRSAVAALSLAAMMVAAAQSDQGQQQVNLIRATQFMGKPVDTQDSQNAGRIENMALDLNNGTAVYIILNTSGAPDMGNRFLAVPFRALEISDARTPTVKLNVNKQRLHDAPSFDPAGWNKIGDQDWGRIVHEFYGLQPRLQNERDLTLVRATDALGMTVNGKQRDNIGQVEDLLIDGKRAVIPVAIVAFTKGPAAGDKLVAMPMKGLDPVRGEKALVINIDAEKLRDAPSFEKRNWPNSFNAGYVERVYTAFNMQPDPVYGYAPPMGGDARDSRSRNDQDFSFSETQGGWVQNTEYGRLFKADKIETVKGKILSVGKFTPMKDMSEGVMVRLRVDNDETIEVHLGPAWYIDRQQHEFKEGNEVTVTGSRIQFQGHPTIMATQVRKGDRVLLLRDHDGLPRWDAWLFAKEADREK